MSLACAALARGHNRHVIAADHSQTLQRKMTILTKDRHRDSFIAGARRSGSVYRPCLRAAGSTRERHTLDDCGKARGIEGL